MNHKLCPLTWAAALCGCATTASAAPLFLPAVQVGTVTHPQIDEASGLAASELNPGVLWVHNDSGDSSRVFAIGTSGRLLGTYSLCGAAALDWEDIAVGPGPTADVPSLYLGS